MNEEKESLVKQLEMLQIEYEKPSLEYKLEELNHSQAMRLLLCDSVVKAVVVKDNILELLLKTKVTGKDLAALNSKKMEMWWNVKGK